MSGIGHNQPPKDRGFKRRWATAIFDCADRKKPVGAVAMAFRLFHDMDGDGRGVALSDLDIAVACGVSDRSVRTFKAWLVGGGYIKVLARGGRGGQTEYQACIPDDNQPEKSAGETSIQPEVISGNLELNRQSIPEIENELPAKISGQTNQPEKSAGNPSSVTSLARVEDNINIYNKNNNLPSLSETVAARETVQIEVKPDEEHIGHGVIVNCETVRHRDFVISLKSIEIQLCGAIPMERIKAAAVGQAIQWAVEIEAGKPPFKVVPDKPGNFIRGSLQAQQRNDTIAAVKRDAAKPRGSKPSRFG